jgi:ribonuclease HI
VKAKGGVRLTFDGGSRGNPGPAYGSFRVRGSGTASTIQILKRLRFGHGTNNEAEYWSLLEGLRWTLKEAGRELSPGWLSVHGDSLLVIRQLEGEWKARDSRMRRLRDEANLLLVRFKHVQLKHRPREHSVAEFGH